jgi:hypothetical protein
MDAPASHDHRGVSARFVEPSPLRRGAAQPVSWWSFRNSRQHRGGKYTPENEIPNDITAAAIQWPGRLSGMGSVSQTLAVLSMLPVARRRPSGLNATPSTPLV